MQFLTTFSFLFLSFHISTYGQSPRNYAQELYDLLLTGRNFEAIGFKAKHQDVLPPDLDLIYQMHMSLAFNKPDSTISYFEEFLSNSFRVNHIGPVVGNYFVRLCETYEIKQQFDKAITTVQRHIHYLEENPYSIPPDALKKEIEEAKVKIALLKNKQDHEPIRRIKRADKNIVIKLKNDVHIRFDVLFNGHVIETFFDTGATEFCMMEKDLADKIGIKYKPNQDSIRLVNGKPTRAIEGYLDSLDIQGTKLYNLPVGVFLDKFIAHVSNQANSGTQDNDGDNLLKNKQVILGLPSIKMIGRMEFDWKANTLLIPSKSKQKEEQANLPPNFMLLQQAAYVHLKFQETEFTGFLDTGSDHYLFLTYPFFFKSNSDYVRNDPHKTPYSRTGFLDVQQNIERYRVANPQIWFDGKKIDSSKPQREVYTLANLNNFDGEVGIGFFRNNYGKTAFDFEVMRIECEE